MRFRSLSPNCTRARHFGASSGVPLLQRSFFSTALCAGALIVAPLTVGPLVSPVQAAPTLGGDANGPQVQILQPSYQEVVKSTTKILVAIKSQKFNPQTVEIFFDDKPDSSGPMPIAALASAAYDWNTKLLTDGPHKLTVRVTDTQGFRGWAEVNVYINNGKKVDSLPPSLDWLNLEAYQQLSGTAEVQLQAVDNFGIKWIIVSVNPASEPNKKPALRSWLLNRPPYAVKFDTTRVADGLYQFTAKAWDSFEQEGVANPLTVGIINRGGINATTLADMLRTMRQSQPAAPRTLPAKAAPEPNVAAPQTDRTTQATAPTAAPPPKPVKAGATTPKVALQPSPPKVVDRATAASKAQIARGAAPSRVAASPRLSPPKMPKINAAQGTNSGVEAEIKGALADDWRTQLARVAAPSLAPKEFLSADATLSASRASNDLSLIGRRELSQEILGLEKRNGTDRIAAPSGEARPVSGGPAWSQSESRSSERLSSILPLKVEVEAEAAPHNGRVSASGQLLSRSVAPTRQGAPAFSSPIVPTRSRVSDRVLPTADAAASSSSLRVAAPNLGSERAVPLSRSATMSVSTPTVEPKMSAKGPLSLAVEALKAQRVGKVSSPNKTRLAALPRSQKSASRGQFDAITVSPLEVKTSDAIPAFHHVARSTDLRAVAARYGLPVDVIAACNNWPSDMKLVAGTNVKLPQQLKVAYQGVPIKADAPSLLVGGTGVTAFRFMFEQAGGKMEWDAKKQRVIARKGKSEVVLMIGSNKAKVGDKDVMMELAAFLFEGRTMVPVRFFEEGLHAQVEWDPQTGRIVVAMAN